MSGDNINLEALAKSQGIPSGEKALTKSQIAAVMNEWYRKYKEAPKDFDEHFLDFQFSNDEEYKLNYGEVCAEFMFEISKELNNG